MTLLGEFLLYMYISYYLAVFIKIGTVQNYFIIHVPHISEVHTNISHSVVTFITCHKYNNNITLYACSI